MNKPTESNIKIIISFPLGWSFRQAHAHMTKTYPKLYWSWYDGTIRPTFYIPLDEII